MQINTETTKRHVARQEIDKNRTYVHAKKTYIYKYSCVYIGVYKYRRKFVYTNSHIHSQIYIQVQICILTRRHRKQ